MKLYCHNHRFQDSDRITPSLQKKIFIALGVLLLLGAIATADDETPQFERSINRRQVQSIRNDLELPLQGITKPGKLAQLTARVPGGISKIHVAEGQWVEAGSILAVIENDSSKAAVEIARAEAAQRGFVEQATSDWKMEYQRFQRLQSLINSRVTSSLELEEKAAILEQKKAKLVQAEEQKQLSKAKLNQTLVDLERHNLVAPFRGQIVQIHAKRGTAPQPGDPVITIVDMSELEVEMHLPLSHFGKINVGDRIQLSASAPINRDIQANVVSVSPLINPTSGTFRCLFKIDNADKAFPAGFVVSLKSE